ncbi:MAG: multiprotein bridging factor aMBF1 [Candidatus Woesearchaeota archaeon]
MQCNICGKKITSGYKINLEGSEMLACNSCSNHGDRIKKVYENKKEHDKDNKKDEKSVKKIKETTNSKGEEILDFVENFDKKIRKKREAMDMKQEEFSKFLNIKSSLLHQLESGKKCNVKIARKIERKLDIKLLERVEIGDPNEYKSKSKSMTIGDLIKEKLNKK